MQSDYLRFADNQRSLGGQEATKQGKSLLGMIFGAGDITNLVCGVAEKTGISAGVVTNILLIMTLVGRRVRITVEDNRRRRERPISLFGRCH